MTDRTIHPGVPAFWQEAGGQAWVRLQGLLDRINQPVADAIERAVAPSSGQHILDVGCGGGATTLGMARRVGAAGRATGIDISGPLLSLARERAGAEGVTNVDFILADAQRHSFEPATFDAVISRFGVMFFADPEAAFANLRTALRPEGRLAFACWRSPAENPLTQLPMKAAAPLLSEAMAPPADGPGRFAFADRLRVGSILERSGWRDVDIEPLDVPTPATFDEMMQLSLELGTLGPLLARESEANRSRIREAVAEGLRPHVAPDGLVHLVAACWLVAASR